MLGKDNTPYGVLFLLALVCQVPVIWETGKETLAGTQEATLGNRRRKRLSRPAYLPIHLAIGEPNDTPRVTTYRTTETHQRRRVVREAPPGGQVTAPNHFAVSRPAIAAHESVSNRPVVRNTRPGVH